MKTTLILLFLVFAATAGGAVKLQINNTDYDVIALKTGQSVTVQIVSDDAAVYGAYIGFDDSSSILGTFTHLATLTEAGNLASVTAVAPPPVEGFYVSAVGASPAPSPGIHFTFTYVPNTLGTTTLYLNASDAATLLDAIDINVEPDQVGSSFTYQGRLIDDNEALDAAYDFEFRLYDAPTDGTQLGIVNEADDLTVISGYFTVELDFGASPYDGDSVWLEVAVRDGDSTGAYTVLTPRQRLTATPYASYAAASDWNNLANIPADIADGDDVGVTAETDPEVGANTTNYVPRWDGSVLVTGSIADDGANAGVPYFHSDAEFYIFSNDETYGLLCLNQVPSDSDRYAVFANAPGDTAGDSYGVYGRSLSPTSTNYGVSGQATISSTGNNYGVYGYAYNNGTGDAWAGYFSGKTYVSGPLGVGTSTPEGKLQVTGDEVRIGNSGTVDYATGDGDLYVEDALEVDGDIHASNMPGCEFTAVTNLTNVPTSITDVVSTELTLNSSGYIILTFSGYVNIDTAGDWVTVSISTSPTYMSTQQVCDSQSVGDDIPFSVQRVFTVTAGTYTYYGNAASNLGTSDIYNAQMTAMFFPVRY